MGLLDITYSDINGKKPRNAGLIYESSPVNMSGLLDAATMIPVVGDVLSGGMAVYDAAKGNYGSAAMNAIGVLPFVSAAPFAAMKAIDKAAQMKGVTTNAGNLAQSMPNQAGAIVWHGSPHKFNKFDMSKIGTGEGAQAYGHGLYVAEAPTTASWYKKTLSGVKPEFKPSGYDVTGWWDQAKKLYPNDPAKQEAWHALAQKNDWSDPEKVARWGKETAYSPASAKVVDDVVNDIYNPGALYKVDIPDEAVARFLDWDKPLSQQAPEVQAALSAYKGVPAKGGEGWGKVAGKSVDRTGADIYLDVSAKKGAGNRADQSATEYFQSLGIPGIRYLDGGSRGQQAGTSNFVLFDDQMPRIIEINGVPTGNKPWANGEWKGLIGI